MIKAHNGTDHFDLFLERRYEEIVVLRSLVLNPLVDLAFVDTVDGSRWELSSVPERFIRSESHDVDLPNLFCALVSLHHHKEAITTFFVDIHICPTITTINFVIRKLIIFVSDVCTSFGSY